MDIKDKNGKILAEGDINIENILFVFNKQKSLRRGFQVLPSGGKSYLANHYPRIFADIDEFCDILAGGHKCAHFVEAVNKVQSDDSAKRKFLDWLGGRILLSAGLFPFIDLWITVGVKESDYVARVKAVKRYDLIDNIGIDKLKEWARDSENRDILLKNNAYLSDLIFALVDSKLLEEFR